MGAASGFVTPFPDAAGIASAHGDIEERQTAPTKGPGRRAEAGRWADVSACLSE